MAGVVGLGLLALATVLPLAVSVFRGDYRPRSRYLFDLIGAPSAAFSVYLATGFWQAGIVALVILQVGSAEASVYGGNARDQSGTRRRLTGLGVTFWILQLATLVAALFSLEGTLRALLYLFLISGLYGAVVADHSKARATLGSLGVYSLGIAAIIALAVVLVLSEYTYEDGITAPWLAIFIYRYTVMVAVAGILAVPLALWVDAGEPGSRS